VFPYHYRNQDNSLADLASFKQQVGRTSASKSGCVPGIDLHANLKLANKPPLSRTCHLACALGWAKARLEKSPRHLGWVKVKHDNREVN
jgi:hypothetical protein